MLGGWVPTSLWLGSFYIVKKLAANYLGCSPSAQGHRRQRGCRGHGAQQKRAQQRSQQAAVSQDQRAARRRSDPISLESIAGAVHAQCDAITAMTTAVQQFVKQMSNFLLHRLVYSLTLKRYVLNNLRKLIGQV